VPQTPSSTNASIKSVTKPVNKATTKATKKAAAAATAAAKVEAQSKKKTAAVAKAKERARARAAPDLHEYLQNMQGGGNGAATGAGNGNVDGDADGDSGGDANPVRPVEKADATWHHWTEPAPHDTFIDEPAHASRVSREHSRDDPGDADAADTIAEMLEEGSKAYTHDFSPIGSSSESVSQSSYSSSGSESTDGERSDQSSAIGFSLDRALKRNRDRAVGDGGGNGADNTASMSQESFSSSGSESFTDSDDSDGGDDGRKPVVVSRAAPPARAPMSRQTPTPRGYGVSRQVGGRSAAARNADDELTLSFDRTPTIFDVDAGAAAGNGNSKTSSPRQSPPSRPTRVMAPMSTPSHGGGGLGLGGTGGGGGGFGHNRSPHSRAPPSRPPSRPSSRPSSRPVTPRQSSRALTPRQLALQNQNQSQKQSTLSPGQSPYNSPRQSRRGLTPRQLPRQTSSSSSLRKSNDTDADSDDDDDNDEDDDVAHTRAMKAALGSKINDFEVTQARHHTVSGVGENYGDVHVSIED
jgi:hypothetical protein